MSEQPRGAADPVALSYAEQPLVIDDASQYPWDETTDLLVVGYGGAGVSAALEARERGAEVLAVDRFDGGGATTLSGGVVYAGGTRHQKAAGLEDSADTMYRYLKMEIGDVVRDETLRRFCDGSDDNMRWLESHGVQFGSSVYTGKSIYPPEGYDIYFSGNEKVTSSAKVVPAFPRGHRVVGDKYTGHVFFNTLKASADRLGVVFRGHARVTRLVVTPDNRVVGAEIAVIDPGTRAHGEHRRMIERFNRYQRFFASTTRRAARRIAEFEQRVSRRMLVRARNGVVLCTGSFAFNRDMVKAYAPKYEEAVPLGTLGCDGSGIALGHSVGGDLGKMDSVTAWRSISPPYCFVKGMVVNRDGRRFVTEDAYVGRLGHELAQQPGCQGWLIIDRALYREAFKSALTTKGIPFFEYSGPAHQLHNLLRCTRKAATIEGLAKKCGIDAAGLAATLARYNADAEKGEDAELGKIRDYLRPLAEGPYYALDISVGNTRNPLPSIPMGGLRVDEDTGNVIDRDGRRIEGLYAAGRAAVGVPSGFYVSGSALADCVFAGRRAAASALGARDSAPAGSEVVNG
ncbi:MAG: FAD-binding protein [Porticoccaceae bacterium]